MLKHLVEKFEREASDFCRREIQLSEESFYSGEQRSYYKRLIINGKQTNHHIDLFHLQESNSRGRMNEVVRRIAGYVLLG